MKKYYALTFICAYLSDTNTLETIELSAEFKNFKDYKMYRYHSFTSLVIYLPLALHRNQMSK